MTCTTGSVFQVIHSDNSITNNFFDLIVIKHFCKRKVKESSELYDFATIISSSCSVKSSEYLFVLSLNNNKKSMEVVANPLSRNS